MQQLLTESLVLGVLAGVVGLMAAAASLQLFVRLLPADTPRLGNVALHGSVLLFAAIASVVAGFVFGLIPAMKAVRTVSSQLLDTLRSGSRGVAGKASQFRLSRFLVIGQIASSVVVITVAGLLLHSLYKLSQVNPGFNTARIVTAEVALDSTACQQTGRCESFFQTLLERARGIAGTQAVALTDSLPMSGWDTNYVYDAEGHPRQARQGARVATGRTVSSDYFSVLGLQLVRGRLLTPSDASGASRAAVIDQSMAARLWPHQDPIGKHLISVADEAVPTVWDPQKASIVVGVVRNAREGSLENGYQDEVFLPMTALKPHPTMYVLLRTHIPPSEAAAASAQSGRRHRSAGSRHPGSHVESSGLGLRLCTAIAHSVIARLRHARCRDRRSRCLQPDRLHRQLAHSRDRHSPGARGTDEAASRLASSSRASSSPSPDQSPA